MNSALKPVMPQAGVAQTAGQASPVKANVPNVNHAVGHPQGAQNSLNHTTNNLVVQNLTHHTPSTPQLLPHPVPSMAPVTANMAQMAQNMSHHGNLSHVTQNSVTPANTAASPSKSASTSGPLSLIQPLALTRTLDKKELDSTGPANGTIDSPKSTSNTPPTLKPTSNPETKDKQDIAKTSPSTPKPPEKPTGSVTPQKSEVASPVSQTDSAQPKVATGSEPEKSPNKPAEPKAAPTADVAPTQSDSKPVPESANDNRCEEKASTPQKQEPSTTESAKTEAVPKVEEKKEETKEKPVECPAPAPAPTPLEEKKAIEVAKVEQEKPEPPKKEEPVEKLEKVEEKLEEKKPETRSEPVKPPKPEVKAKSTLKLATVTPPMRKRRQTSPNKTNEATPGKKPTEGEATPDTRTKRNRTQVQLYQSPTPELTMATKLSASVGRSTPTKPNDDKLIVFYKNEYLAVRNAEGGFYVCQAMQNVYRTTRKIRIRWLSQDKTEDPSGQTYKPDFYDVTDMECVLTTLSLSRAPGGGGGGSGGGAGGARAQILRPEEAARARSILERALHVESSGAKGDIELTEEHPDGLDLSLYTDESQLEKKSRKRSSAAALNASPRARSRVSQDAAKEEPPSKRARTTPKRSPKSASKPKASPPKPTKRVSAGSKPTVASTSKTATAVSEKTKSKGVNKRASAPPTPAQTTPPTPARKHTRASKESKAAVITPTPSTSTGKTTRTPRKPPAKK